MRKRDISNERLEISESSISSIFFFRVKRVSQSIRKKMKVNFVTLLIKQKLSHQSYALPIIDSPKLKHNVNVF